MLLLKEGSYREALDHLEFNARAEYRQKRQKAEALLWAGRCSDLLNNRAGALEYYKSALALKDPEITPAAARGINRPFKKKGLLNVEPELVTGGVVAGYR